MGIIFRIGLVVCLFLGLAACQRSAAPTEGPAALAVGARPTGTPQVVARVGAPTPAIVPPTLTVVSQAAAPARPDYPTGTPEPERPAFQTYTVKSGDTLSGIAAKAGVGVTELMKANSLSNPNIVQVGQQLRIPVKVEVVAPVVPLFPDSEVVYGPTSRGFDVEGFAREQPGYLKDHTENVEGRVLSGPQIVQLVAQRYSVAPRLLLALIELRGGWLSNATPDVGAKTYPMGKIDPGRARLFLQASWAANQINEGFYGWKGRQRSILTFKDGGTARMTPALNAGTLGVQFLLAQFSTADEFGAVVGAEGSLLKTYTRYFGDPYARAADPVIPPDVRQPDLVLPWPRGERWYYTGGPHGGWGAGSAWAALDFVPGTQNMGGCWDASNYWVTASGPGVVVRSENGEVMVDMDGDGSETTGWNILYMHISRRDRIAVGTRVQTGDRIGHPSCEGGFSTATHLHVARKYNGEWVASDGPIPFVLSGWAAKSIAEYDGTMVRGGETRESCECRVEDKNGLVADR